MAVFVVERYLPALTAEDVRAQAHREAALAADTVGVRHVRTTYLCDDELCFSLFEASSLDVLQEANRRARMAYERITAAIDVTDQVVPG